MIKQKNIIIGNSHYSLDGLIDNVHVWKITLNQDQILETMKHNISGNEPGLVGYWQFNEIDGQAKQLLIVHQEKTIEC